MISCAFGRLQLAVCSTVTRVAPSPMLGYEGSFGYDPKARLLIRWAGHNQGGGGEQNAETWTFNPASAKYFV